MKRRPAWYERKYTALDVLNQQPHRILDAKEKHYYAEN